MTNIRKKYDVLFMGLGYIGLPTAALVASTGKEVLGVDIDKKKLANISKGKVDIQEKGLVDLVETSIQSGHLTPSLEPKSSKTYVIVVPTPFTKNHEPDISYVKTATETIIPYMEPDDLFIIESTSPIGTTEIIAEMIFNQRPDLKDQLYIAYCPERILPGNAIYELIHNDRIVGGIDEASAERAAEFYQSFVKGEIHKTNAKTAEMCKLVENSSRDVQIAFANELSLICDKAGINVWELIQLANKHPRVNILNPGSGVGGHCLAVDPYFLTSDYPMESQLIGQARKTNNYKAFWCAEKIRNEINDFKIKNKRNPVVALMGLAFKPNIEDLRQSPALFIVHKVIQSTHNEFLIVEPNLKEHSTYKLHPYQKAFDKADIVAFLVAHNEFFTLQKSNQIILDFCGIYK